MTPLPAPPDIPTLCACTGSSCDAWSVECAIEARVDRIECLARMAGAEAAEAQFMPAALAVRIEKMRVG